jgi:hypothetical protein
VGIETYNEGVHGARVGPQSGIRGTLTDSLVPTVVGDASRPLTCVQADLSSPLAVRRA